METTNDNLDPAHRRVFPANTPATDTREGLQQTLLHTLSLSIDHTEFKPVSLAATKDSPSSIKAARQGSPTDYYQVGQDLEASDMPVDHQAGDIASAKTVPLEGQRKPKDDHRSAEQILKDAPLYDQLSDEQKEGLKKQVGDYTKDADAAWRLEQVLQYIDSYYEDGRPDWVQPNYNLDGDYWVEQVDDDEVEADWFKEYGSMPVAGGNGKLSDSESGMINRFISGGYQSGLTWSTEVFFDDDDDTDKVKSSADVYWQAMKQIAEDGKGDAQKVVDSKYFDGGSASSVSAADKLDYLIELMEAKAKYETYDANVGPDAIDPRAAAAKSQRDPDDYYSKQEFLDDIQARIDELNADPEVQKLLSSHALKAMKGIVQDSGSPELKAAYQRQYDHYASADMLAYDLNKKDADGKTVSTDAAVQAYWARLIHYGTIVGMSEDEIKADAKKAYAELPQATKEKILEGYSHVTDGTPILKAIENGDRIDEAVGSAATLKLLYDSLFDADTVKKGSEDFAKSIEKGIEAAAAKSKTDTKYKDDTQAKLASFDLVHALRTAESEGGPTAAQALKDYIEDIAPYARSMGLDPVAYCKERLAHMPGGPEIHRAMTNLNQDYQDLISGKTIIEDIKNGSTVKEAVDKASEDYAIYAAVLDDKRVAEGEAKFTKTLNDLAETLKTASEDDPDLRAQLIDGYSDTLAGFEEALKQKDADGKTMSTADALWDYINHASVYGDALGLHTEIRVEMQYIIASDETKAKIGDAYKDLLSGERLKTLLEDGVPPAEAVAKVEQEKKVFEFVIPKDKLNTGEFVDHMGDPTAFIQSLAGSDPDLYHKLQDTYKLATEAPQFASVLNNTGGLNENVNVIVGVERYVTSAISNGAYLSRDGADAVQAAYHGLSGQDQERLAKAYEYITSGQELKDLIAQGVDAKQALEITVSHKTQFDVFMPTAQQDASAADFDTMLANASLNVALGLSPDGSTGNIDLSKFPDPEDPNFETTVKDYLIQMDPAMANNLTLIDEVVKLVRGLLDVPRHGMTTASEASEYWAAKIKNTPHGKGVMHTASGVLLAMALGSTAATGQELTTAALMSTSTVVGFFINGYSKYTKSNLGDAPKPTWLDNMDGVGKLAHAVGSWAGVFGGVTAASDATGVEKGFLITGTVAGTVQALTDTVDLGAWLATRFGAWKAATLDFIPGMEGAAIIGRNAVQGGAIVAEASTAARVAGIVGGVAGVIAAAIGVGFMIYSIVKGSSDMEKAKSEVEDDFADLGIDVPEDYDMWNS